jgi:hypothetical protein
MKRGIVEACTGVMRANPIAETASRIHLDKGGVRTSHALDLDGDSAGDVIRAKKKQRQRCHLPSYEPLG